jgi:hypothetical protein
VAIPGSVTNLGDGAFYATALTNVTIPDTVANIGDSAFQFCAELTSVTIPGSVTNIGDSAFQGCFGLGSVTIPGSVASIGDYAFYGCPSLSNVYFTGNAPTADSTAISSDYDVTAYYLPGTTGWGTNFGGIPTAPWVLPNPVILNNGASFGVQTNRFGFVISWATNASVVVEACTDLADPVWSPVATNTLTDGSSYFSEPVQRSLSGRYYRLSAP